MGTKIRKLNCQVVTNGCGFFVDPQKLEITKEKILEYVKNNPMPIDSEYDLEDLVYDLTKGKYPFMLPDEIKEETKIFIEKIIDDLQDGRKYDIWR